MILYKYTDLETGKKIIENSTLAFTMPKYLNDPLETAAGTHPRDDTSIWVEFNRWNALNKYFPILSLTRNPLNAVMWAHYGVSHTGLVIGIDCDLAELNNLESCVLPVKFGSMIYTASQPTHSYLASESVEIMTGMRSSFCIDHLEAFQRMMLYKGNEWSYEEEVRAVKNVTSIKESGGNFINNDQERMLFPINKLAIVSVHVGVRTYTKNEEGTFQLLNWIKEKLPHIRLYSYSIEKGSWRLKDRELTDWRSMLRDDFNSDEEDSFDETE